MQRRSIAPRDNWQQKVEAVGLTFHTLENGDPYWDESACYHFLAAEIDTLEAAGNTLQEMCHPRPGHRSHRVGLEQRAARPLRPLRPRLEW